MWTEKEFTYDVSYNNQTTTTIETETSSDEDDISGPTMIRELKTGLYGAVYCNVHMYVCVCVYVPMYVCLVQEYIYIYKVFVAFLQEVHLLTLMRMKKMRGQQSHR